MFVNISIVHNFFSLRGVRMWQSPVILAHTYIIYVYKSYIRHICYFFWLSLAAAGLLFIIHLLPVCGQIVFTEYEILFCKKEEATNLRDKSVISMKWKSLQSPPRTKHWKRQYQTVVLFCPNSFLGRNVKVLWS